jgi:hypothetical protein
MSGKKLSAHQFLKDFFEFIKPYGKQNGTVHNTTRTISLEFPEGIITIKIECIDWQKL